MKSRILNRKVLKVGKEYYRESKTLDRVCIDRPVGGIGDVLMATVAMREFKRENPNTKLTVAIDRHTTYDDTYYKLIYNAPFIDEIIDSRHVDKRAYDEYWNIKSVCIQREHSRFPNLNRIDIFAKACSVKHIKDHLPFYEESNFEKRKAEKYISSFQNRKKIFIHSASNEGKRSYNPRNLERLIAMLREEYPECKLLISDFNRVLQKSVFKTYNCEDVSSLNIRDTASLIKRSDLFVGPDSGLMHLAGAVGTRSLVIFGSIPPEVRINHYPTHESVTLKGLSCLGCWYKQCDRAIECMVGLKPEVILNRIRRML